MSGRAARRRLFSLGWRVHWRAGSLETAALPRKPTKGVLEMNKTKVLLGGALAASIVAGLAMATPTIGAWYNVILSTGTVNRDVHAHAYVALPGTQERFNAEPEPEAAANSLHQDAKFS